MTHYAFAQLRQTRYFAGFKRVWGAVCHRWTLLGVSEDPSARLEMINTHAAFLYKIHPSNQNSIHSLAAEDRTCDRNLKRSPETTSGAHSCGTKNIPQTTQK